MFRKEARIYRTCSSGLSINVNRLKGSEDYRVPTFNLQPFMEVALRVWASRVLVQRQRTSSWRKLASLTGDLAGVRCFDGKRKRANFNSLIKTRGVCDPNGTKNVAKITKNVVQIEKKSCGEFLICASLPRSRWWGCEFKGCVRNVKSYCFALLFESVLEFLIWISVKVVILNLITLITVSINSIKL